MPDVIRPCCVVVFAVFNCLLDLPFSELYICGVKFAYVSVDYSVCSACCVFDGVSELFVECVWYLFVCGGCFVAEGDSLVVSPCIVLHSVRVFFL